MVVRQPLRPGGRSERVQKAVHAAVRRLASRLPESDLAVPLVAAEAGVTPSTIYRRWGTLADLVADVALERLRPDGGPRDTGSLRGDLAAWLEQYAEEMSSGPGRALIRDVLAGSGRDAAAARCCSYVRDHLEEMLRRAARRGEPLPDADDLLDIVVAPVVYRLLFVGDTVPLARQGRLIDLALSRPSGRGPETGAPRRPSP